MRSVCHASQMHGTGGIDQLQQLDAALASLARGEAALRLRLGQLLEVVGRGSVSELGFSSLGAYAVERCERGGRWAEVARCVARRLEALPQLRWAMAMGHVSWSMGELLARVATPADEGHWLERAQSRTVRQVRVLVAQATTARRQAAAMSADDTFCNLHSGESDETCTLTCTVDREDAWLFEATRCLLDQLGVQGAVAQTEALLAEAQSTLLASLPKGTLDANCNVAQERWAQQLRRWRDEAEACCEKNFLDELRAARAVTPERTRPVLPVAIEAALGIAPLEHESCTALDGQVRAIAAALAAHDLELSLLVLRFQHANGWRRLGYATEAQYARERLGLSRSSLLARRALALRLQKLPGIAAALGAAQIGVEAALQLVRIATPKTEAAWLARARRRTIKHLREEVAAALVAVRLADERDCFPPDDTEMAAFEALEQAVVSGSFHPSRSSNASIPRLSEPVSEPRRAWYVMLGSLAAWLEGGLQTSAAGPGVSSGGVCSSAGRVMLRLRMSREAYLWWLELEAQARPWLASGVSWLRFLCLSVWDAWRHLLGADVAYGHIYIRDRFRCTSPVCNRRDVTPHHLQFRSAGGSDDDHNIASVCAWCHLRGVHGGRIRAKGTAGNIRWELGPTNSPCVIVQGRERLAA